MTSEFNFSISIIIPCHNSARFLGETLQSLADQTCREFEVIAVDDYSTDETLEVLQSFTGRFKLKIVKPPAALKSASASRNFGYTQATGKFIKFLDSDDMLSPDLLRRQLTRLEQATGDTIAAANWSRFYVQPNEKGTQAVGFSEDLAPSEWILRSMEAGHSMMQCGMFLIPRALINTAGLWRPEPSPTDDFEFFIRLVLSAQCVAATDGVLWYRSGLNGSLSRKRDMVHAENAALRIQEGLDRLLQHSDVTRAKPLAGRIYMEWACTLYPEHKSIAKRLEIAARTCGVITHETGGGRWLRLIGKLCGWKLARRLQYHVYRLGYENLALEARRSQLSGSKTFIS